MTTTNTTPTNETTTFTAAEIQTVYIALKERKIHPEGSFDRQGRWYPTAAENVNLDHIREPSRRYPFSYMTACRTLRHVKALAEQSPELFAKHLARAAQ